MKLRPTTDKVPYPIIYVLCMCYSIVITLSCYSIRISKEEQWQLIQLNYPSMVPQFQRLREFSIVRMTYELITLLVLNAVGTFKTTLVISVLVFRMYNVLFLMQSQLSRTTLAKHKIALKCLVLQVSSRARQL